MNFSYHSLQIAHATSFDFQPPMLFSNTLYEFIRLNSMNTSYNLAWIIYIILCKFLIINSINITHYEFLILPIFSIYEYEWYIHMTLYEFLIPQFMNIITPYMNTSCHPLWIPYRILNEFFIKSLWISHTTLLKYLITTTF